MSLKGGALKLGTARQVTFPGGGGSQKLHLEPAVSAASSRRRLERKQRRTAKKLSTVIFKAVGGVVKKGSKTHRSPQQSNQPRSSHRAVLGTRDQLRRVAAPPVTLAEGKGPQSPHLLGKSLSTLGCLLAWMTSRVKRNLKSAVL